jgi:hypothetical protein
MISKSFASHHFDNIRLGKYIRINNCSCGAKSKYEHGDSLHVIKISSSSTKIMKIHDFSI